MIVTTPNQEFNVLHGLPPGAFRHPDHRFEWSRAKFRAWATGAAERNGYAVSFGDIGECDPLRGSSTQMALFQRARCVPTRRTSGSASGPREAGTANRHPGRNARALNGNDNGVFGLREGRNA